MVCANWHFNVSVPEPAMFAANIPSKPEPKCLVKILILKNLPNRYNDPSINVRFIFRKVASFISHAFSFIQSFVETRLST